MFNLVWNLFLGWLFLMAGIFSAMADAPVKGHIVVDPEYPQWLAYQQGGPLFMCGPGDPEDFLYRGSLNPDGTRNGDQLALINKLKATGANSIYLQAIRSHGGDGEDTHNPFIGHDPRNPLNALVLDQWETWFKEMDENGIVIYFFLYDDSAVLWRTGDTVGVAERKFVHGLVNRFEHHRNLIWVVAEEYSEAYTPARVSNIAAEIHAADDYDHVIAVHKRTGLSFAEFANDQHIGQFAIQYDSDSAAVLHQAAVAAWHVADGRYNLNMSEVADSSRQYGIGSPARRKSWAIALGGAYIMALGWDIKTTPVETLKDCGRLVEFMVSTSFNEMSPHDELRYQGTDYVLALPGVSYIAYSADSRGKRIGLKRLSAGLYDFLWYDVVTGSTVVQKEVSVSGGNRAWTPPPSLGGELAVYLKRVDQ